MVYGNFDFLSQLEKAYFSNTRHYYAIKGFIKTSARHEHICSA